MWFGNKVEVCSISHGGKPEADSKKLAYGVWWYHTRNAGSSAGSKEAAAAAAGAGRYVFREEEVAQMKAWSRAQANQEREANLYHHHQVGSLEQCSCLFTSSTIDGVIDKARS